MSDGPLDDDGTPNSSFQSSPSNVLAVLPDSDLSTDADNVDDAPRSSAVIGRDSALPVWRPILSDSSQVVLYNAASHALTVRRHEGFADSHSTCPYCNRPLQQQQSDTLPLFDESQAEHTRVSNYFQLLEVANETNSRPASPRGPRLRSTSGFSGETRTNGGPTFKAETMAEGYFNAFFKEEQKLGMGANGSVYLCQHILDGNLLGHFAVKKIAVGQSHSYLTKILREVRLLETLRHPNIITYHHAWLESYQFSSFGPRVPTLFVLMQWAEGGSLDDFIETRLGHPHNDFPTLSDHLRNPSGRNNMVRKKSDRIRAFRAAQRQSEQERQQRREERVKGVRTAIHLLSAVEAKSLFSDVATGLAFLHDKSILHLDLKPGNVLLTWDDEALIPRAMLSDFGTSRDMVQPSSRRTGNTGTLEYAAPETLPSPTGLLMQVDSRADMWSLGMILHMLLFFKLPYLHYSGAKEKDGDSDIHILEKEVQSYEGFYSTPALLDTLESRGFPSAYLLLLEGLLHRKPQMRPTMDRVMRGLREGTLDPLSLGRHDVGEGALLVRRPSHSKERTDGTNRRTSPEIRDEIKVAEVLPDSDLVDDAEDAPPILALPQPLPPPSFVPGAIQPLLTPWANQIHDLTTLPRRYFIRGLKSCLLLLKVMMLLTLCSEGHPEPLFSCFILGVAISDTWSDDLWISVLLGLLHVVILRQHCSNGRCCV
ncbi:kinase-like protein [Schizopora paradoxa]|uniref:non-specific serine/threonine protein kinase n=1 Tax=Schizopora paradoxa TaxID=27342 RepID=A0A0H2RHJ6_9AGAM|nr:kinase-like protein [Schizopora paradoxa]